MKLDICFLFFVGFLIQLSVGEEKDNGSKENDQPKTLHRSQSYSNEKYSPKKEGRPKKSESKKPKEKEEIIVHNHGDKNYYESKASQYKPVDTYDFDNEYNDDTFDKFIKYFKDNLKKPSDDGFKTSTSVHSEHFEIKELNPKASTPEERYIIRGGYKVQETDPFDSKSKKTHLHTYDSPLSKIAASIYSKFDYLNFPHKTSDDDDDDDEDDNKEKKKKPQEETEEAEASENNEEREEIDKESDDDDDEEEYNAGDFAEFKKALYNDKEEEEEEEDDAEKKEEKEKNESGDYSTQPSTEQKKVEENDDDNKDTEAGTNTDTDTDRDTEPDYGYEYSYPDFPTEIDEIYSDEWKKYILELVYGDFEDDFFSPSSMYEVSVRAKRKAL